MTASQPDAPRDTQPDDGAGRVRLAGPVVVLGLMGSGKTTAASRLAAELGVALRDSDVDIEAAHGRTAGVIAREDGADALHALEARQLLDALAERPPVVVAAAASTIEDDACRAALAAPGVTAVWLDAPDEVLGRRWSSGPHRPRFGPDVLAMLDEQGRRRRPRFAAVADLRIDTAATTPAQATDRVLEHLAGRTADRAADRATG